MISRAGSNPSRTQLAREERPVAVGALAADELRARQDDGRARPQLTCCKPVLVSARSTGPCAGSVFADAVQLDDHVAGTSMVSQRRRFVKIWLLALEQRALVLQRADRGAAVHLEPGVAPCRPHDEADAGLGGRRRCLPLASFAPSWCFFAGFFGGGTTPVSEAPPYFQATITSADASTIAVSEMRTALDMKWVERGPPPRAEAHRLLLLGRRRRSASCTRRRTAAPRARGSRRTCAGSP